jgi:ABC-type transporter Mla subunit MlaD
MKMEPRSSQRAVLVGLVLIGVALALTWLVLYLTAGASSSA